MFRLGRWIKDSNSFTLTCGCRLMKQSCMWTSLSWVSCEHIDLPDHRSSVDPSLLWSQSAASLSLAAITASIQSRFQVKLSKIKFWTRFLVWGTVSSSVSDVNKVLLNKAVYSVPCYLTCIYVTFQISLMLVVIRLICFIQTSASC
jgi:hypothetical protein